MSGTLGQVGRISPFDQTGAKSSLVILFETERSKETARLMRQHLPINAILILLFIPLPSLAQDSLFKTLVDENTYELRVVDRVAISLFQLLRLIACR